MLPPPSLPPLLCILPPTPRVHLSGSPPLAHWTACSLAVLPESWGFMTSGSSGGVEKDSILSCSNVSSERRTGNGDEADGEISESKPLKVKTAP